MRPVVDMKIHFAPLRAALLGNAGGKSNAFTRGTAARHSYFDDTCGWRTKTQHVRASRMPEPIPKALIWRAEEAA